MLSKYKQLLDQYYDIIHKPNWYEDLVFYARNGLAIPPIVEEMDQVWEKLTQIEKQKALQYAQELYNKRLLRNGHG